MKLVRFRSTALIAFAALSCPAAPESVAQDCAIESMRHALAPRPRRCRNP